MIPPKRLSKEQALLKIKHYCAYQERSHKEVLGKLYDLGLYKHEAELLISELIQEDYLNEERFAIQLAGGKFRIKQWGKKKIEQALKEKQVSAYCIKTALAQIDEVDYRRTLDRLAEKKWQVLKSEKNIYIKKRKLQDYMLQKGYEYELIREAIKRYEKAR